MKIATTCLFLLTLFELGFSQYYYSLLFDKNLTAYSGAENLVTMHRGIRGVQERVIKPTLFEENKWYKKCAGIGLRSLQHYLATDPINNWLTIVQHEYFGHGSAFREWGCKEPYYKINVPKPYGPGSGLAGGCGGYGDGSVGPLSSQQKMQSRFAGVQSNALLAKSVQIKWLSSGRINYHDADFFLISANETLNYLRWTSDKSSMINDMINYRYEIFSYYQTIEREKLPIVNSRTIYKDVLNIFDTDYMENQALILTLLNPFQYLAAYAYLKTYLWDGKNDFDFPMIPIKNIRYLPSFRYGLTPFGPEAYFENFFVTPKVLNIYFRYGDPKFENYWGGGVEINDIYSSARWQLALSCHFWNQPSIRMYNDYLYIGPSPYQTNEGWGGAFWLTVYSKLLPRSPVQLWLQCGYKTEGFLEGETYHDGAIIRMGMYFIPKNGFHTKS